MLAALHVEEIWRPDRVQEAEQVYGTANPEHPGVAHLLEHSNPVYVGGRVEGVQGPSHYDFRVLRRTPLELRHDFARLGWRRIVAFQTRNPMHRAHQELTLRASKEVGANLLIHPVVGMTKPGDVDHFTRVRCYEALLGTYPQFTAKLSLLNLAMRMRGTEGGALACHHSEEPWVHPSDCGAGPCRPRERLVGDALLRTVRRSGVDERARG